MGSIEEIGPASLFSTAVVLFVCEDLLNERGGYYTGRQIHIIDDCCVVLKTVLVELYCLVQYNTIQYNLLRPAALEPKGH